MGVAVSFVGYTPPARFDDTPWTDVQIEEAATDTGTYTLIDTLSLGTPDPDPASPAARSFTTVNGTAIDQWYRVIFVDAGLTTSEPTAPIQNSSLAIGADPYATVETLAAQLKVNPETRRADLQRVLDAAAIEIDTEIGYHLVSADEKDFALVATVNLSRAADLWVIEGLPVGVIGLGGETPFLTPRNSWDRHANTLAPLKREWGLW